MFQRIGPLEILLIVVVILLIFGPSKLPQLGKAIGDTMREFKKSVKPASEENDSKEKEKEKKV